MKKIGIVLCLRTVVGSLGHRLTSWCGCSLSQHFPDACSLTTTVSYVHDSIGLGRFDKRIPGVPSPCGALRTAFKTDPQRFTHGVLPAIEPEALNKGILCG
jgi:hypothetical protein